MDSVLDLKNRISNSEQILLETKQNAQNREEALEGKLAEHRTKIQDITADLMLKSSTNSSMEMQLKTVQDLNFSKQQDIDQMTTTINDQKERLDKLTSQNKQLDIQIRELYRELGNEEREKKKAQALRDDAISKRVNAEQVCEAINQTVKQLRRELREEREQIEIKRELYFVTTQIEVERLQHTNEEIVSRYGYMQEKHDEAMEFHKENKRKLDEFDAMCERIKVSQGETAERDEQIVFLKTHIENVEQEMKEKQEEKDK